MTTDVSIIIPHYNQPELLRPCLESLAALDPVVPPHEIVIVDDASTDDSVRWIRSEFPNVRLIERSENGGFVAAIESGIAATEGNVLVFLNNDTRVDPLWLKELVEPILSGRVNGAVGSVLLDWEGKEAQFLGATTNYLAQGFELRGPPPALGSPLFPVLCTCGGAMAVSREVYTETGGFDPTFGMLLEDLDFGWRLSLLGYDCQLAPGSRVFHRGHTSLGRESFERKARYYLLNPLRTLFKNADEEDFIERMEAAVTLAEARERVCLLGESARRRLLEGWLSPRTSTPLVAAFTLQEERSRELAAKRQWIQSRRKRTSRELFERFVPEPQRPWWFDEDQKELLEQKGYWSLEREVYQRRRFSR